MPYKPTGNPPGRPRKTEPVIPIVETKPEPSPEPKRLERAREGFRRAFADPAAALHRPPRFGKRKREEVNRRPVLHPYVIAKAE